MSDYPITFDVAKPERFDRSQVFLRLVILVVVSILGAFAWLIALTYIVIPVLSAAFISRDGSDKFVSKTAVRYKRYLHWIASADAYFALLTDKIPLDGPEVASTMEVKIGGRPTTGSALLRLLTSIPSGFVLALFGVVATITGIIAGIFILVREDYPETLYGLHTGVVRWGARLLAYHASLTDEYPPFSLDTRHRDEPRAMPHSPDSRRSFRRSTNQRARATVRAQACSFLRWRCYPRTFDIAKPAKYERHQVFIRILRSSFSASSTGWP